MRDVSGMHRSGVHVWCTPIPSGSTWRVGDGSHRKCRYAGAVERFHVHDFDGPLWDACGCDEYAD